MVAKKKMSLIEGVWVRAATLGIVRHPYGEDATYVLVKLTPPNSSNDGSRIRKVLDTGFQGLLKTKGLGDVPLLDLFVSADFRSILNAKRIDEGQV